MPLLYSQLVDCEKPPFLLIGCRVVSSVGKFPYHRVPCHVGHLLRHSPTQNLGALFFVVSNQSSDPNAGWEGEGGFSR